MTILVNGIIDSCVEELNGHKELRLKIANTSGNRYIASQNADAILYYNDGVSNYLVFNGVVKGADYEPQMLTCTVYDTAYERMQRRLFGVVSTSYIEIPADDILAEICTVAGISVGSCPSTSVSITFDGMTCYDAAVILARALSLDYWSSYSGYTPLFNIGTKGVKTPVTVVPSAISSSGKDRSKNRDGIVVQGMNASGELIVGTAGVSSGDLSIYKVRTVTDVSTLINIANSYLTQSNTDSAGVTLTLPINTGFKLYAGDVVTVSDSFSVNQLALSGNHTIVRIVKKQDSVDAELDRAESLMEQQNEYVDSLGGAPVKTIQGQILMRNNDPFLFVGSGGVNLGGMFVYTNGYVLINNDDGVVQINAGNCSVQIQSGAVYINGLNDLHVNGRIYASSGYA
jgi:hypothetical protein